MQYQICRKYAPYAQMKYAKHMPQCSPTCQCIQKYANLEYALYANIHMHIYAKYMQKYAKPNMHF